MRGRPTRRFTPTADLLRRVAVYGAWLLLLMLIQTGTAPSAPPGRVVPALTLTAVSALGFFDSEKTGAAAGIAAGWVLDAWSGSLVCVMPLVGFAVGYFSGYAAGRRLPRALLPFGVCLGGTALVNMLCTALLCIVNLPSPHLGVLLVHTLLPELGLTLVWGIPITIISRLLVGLIRRQNPQNSEVYNK